MASAIQLDLFNQSTDQNNSEILIFQKNVAPGFSEIAIAWKVIQNLGRGDHHPFTYSYDLEVNANDSWGNYTPNFPASPSEVYQMVFSTTTGPTLQPYPPGAANSKDIDVRNELETGAIGANIYRSDRLLAKSFSDGINTPPVAPGQKAAFAFKPTIFIGVASQIEEGSVIPPAVISNLKINTELSLQGLKSADIIMKGGGPGKPFTFSLQNVVFERYTREWLGGGSER